MVLSSIEDCSSSVGSSVFSFFALGCCWSSCCPLESRSCFLDELFLSCSLIAAMATLLVWKFKLYFTFSFTILAPSSSPSSPCPSNACPPKRATVRFLFSNASDLNLSLSLDTMMIPPTVAKKKRAIEQELHPYPAPNRTSNPLSRPTRSPFQHLSRDAVHPPLPRRASTPSVRVVATCRKLFALFSSSGQGPASDFLSLLT
mmetsp:Transcript_13813/g.55512  ORF Transcript_13813/g.55512 Transcript_13813/m.55512 type:complete len:202 (-) Transcript_13813:6975-7580(-)